MNKNVYRFSVGDLDCADCAATFEDAVRNLEGVETVQQAYDIVASKV